MGAELGLGWGEGAGLRKEWFQGNEFSVITVTVTWDHVHLFSLQVKSWGAEFGSWQGEGGTVPLGCRGLSWRSRRVVWVHNVYNLMCIK